MGQILYALWVDGEMVVSGKGEKDVITLWPFYLKSDPQHQTAIKPQMLQHLFYHLQFLLN